MIRRATHADIPAIDPILRQFKREVGEKVLRVQLERSIDQRELFVADPDGKVVGFVRFHRRRDGWSTLYEIAVDRECRNTGIGRALLYAVPCPVRLKCPVDNTIANRFYAGAGMLLAGTESGNKRNLNIWEMRILYALVKGNNETLPEVARRSGMAYGVRHIDTPRAWPYMLDVEWERFKKKPGEWAKYLELVKQFRPVQAMCVDYEYPSQRKSLYQQIRDLKDLGILRVMVCPKFDGAIAHIPSWCIVAISVPSTYAGFLPDLHEVKGRLIHLLGGTPEMQRDLVVQIAGHGGRVISIDGSSHTNGAGFGSVYADGKWRRKDGEPVDYYAAATYSGANIRQQMNSAAEWQQLPLFNNNEE